MMSSDRLFSERTADWVSALTLATVVVILFKVMNWTPSLKKDGFLPGSSLANLAQERSDGYASSYYVTRNPRHNVAEGMLPYEPPVLWNPGDYAAVRSAVYSSDDALSAAVGMPPPPPPPKVKKPEQSEESEKEEKEGMYGARRPSYVEGMAQSRFSDSALMANAY